MSEPLLSVRDLRVDYVTATGAVRAIDRVSFDLGRGEILGVAGESGSGKSTLAQTLMRILPPPAVVTGGQVLLEGEDLMRMPESRLREVRWQRISMVFQSAMDALNPVMPVSEQITDTLQAHSAVGRREARDRAAELLAMVGIPRTSLDAFPHQLSGGMRQRVCIALALALRPSLVILDEPTTALDVIVEREILEQVRELQAKLGFSVLFITHDLGRMLQFSDRVAVFYAARLAEIGPAAEMERAPRHPYTQGLLRAFPSLRGDAVDREGIPGMPPSLVRPPSGCRFHPRCPLAMDRCRTEVPPPVTVGPGHTAACFAAE
jgi:peptide/nickel transport system ATP-binding protein